MTKATKTGHFPCHICHTLLTSKTRLDNHFRDRHPGETPQYPDEAQVKMEQTSIPNGPNGRPMKVNPETGLPYSIPFPVKNADAVQGYKAFPLCPHCSDATPYTSRAAYGLHLFWAHGIPGLTYKQRSRLAKETPPVAPPDNAASSKVAPANQVIYESHIVPSQHKLQIKEASNGISSGAAQRKTRSTPAQRQSHDLTPEQEVGLIRAFGYLEAYCVQQAARFDLTARDFAERCAEHLRLQTIW